MIVKRHERLALDLFLLQLGIRWTLNYSQKDHRGESQCSKEDVWSRETVMRTYLVSEALHASLRYPDVI